MIKMEFKYIFDANTINNKLPFSCGNIGLLVWSQNLYMNIVGNFIYQIHINLNVDYSFSLKFDNNKTNIDGVNEGKLIIGIESFEKIINNELIQIYTEKIDYRKNLEWIIISDKILIGNEEFFFKNYEIIIRNNIEGFEIPYTFYGKLKTIFFNNYFKSQICNYEIINSYYIVFCDSNKFSSKDIQNFPKINFIKYKLDFNFTFLGAELFYKRDNKYFFKMISYFSNIKTEFVFGRTFLKKYQVIFNSDSKSMYFYKSNIIKNDRYNINDEKGDGISKYNNNTKNVFLFVISYFFIGIIFLFCGIYFGRRFCKFNRKIYANELEDGNDIYEPNNKNNKSGKDKKLIEL